MSSISIQEVNADLARIIATMKPGEEIAITEDDIPIAKLTKGERISWPCKAGSAKDKILWIAPDFDAPLEEFKEYME